MTITPESHGEVLSGDAQKAMCAWPSARSETAIVPGTGIGPSE